MHLSSYRRYLLPNQGDCLKVISSKRQCKKVPLFITDMFVTDNKEKVSLINHNIVCD